MNANDFHKPKSKVLQKIIEEIANERKTVYSDPIKLRGWENLDNLQKSNGWGNWDNWENWMNS